MEKVKIKAELGFNHILITKETSAPSVLITSLDKRNSARDSALKDVQTIVKVGPFVKAENGIDIKEGDKVLLDVGKLSAKNAKIITVAFNKETGEYVEKWSDFKDEQLEYLLLITDREVLMKVG